MWESRLGVFHELMKHRIVNILLVSSSYDLFVIESDGRLADMIVEKYVDLNLGYLPRLTRVSSDEEALELLQARRFDLIIVMLGTGSFDHLTFGCEAKKIQKDIPIVLLAYDATKLIESGRTDLAESVDGVFLWQNDANLVLAIIKLIEDRLNAVYDVEMSGVLVILLVEDSVRFYSSYLPIIYREIVRQTQNLMADASSTPSRLLRMRARPKILMANTYDEALAIYHRFKQNILGIITDAEYPNRNKLDPNAGPQLIKQIKQDQPDIPVVLQSSDDSMRGVAQTLNVSFINKQSKRLHQELQEFIQNNLGFGDFVFRLPNYQEVGRAHDLRSLQTMLRFMPAESIQFHAERNHFSFWLKARTEFSLANRLRPLTVSDFNGVEKLRDYLVKSLEEVQIEKQTGVITQFANIRLDTPKAFGVIGQGSIGGKARGLAFFNALLNAHQTDRFFKDVKILVPQTVVLSTEVFDEHLDRNQLRKLAIEDRSEAELLDAFLRGDFSEALKTDLTRCLTHFDFPLAIRSSSLLEDSKYQPFAGVYETVLLPNCHPNPAVRLQQLCDAIKIVYSSQFYPTAKSYIAGTPYRLGDEKMAVVIQRLIGQRFQNRFYPTLSGVARSHNHYPVPPMAADDGIASVAIGLGKTVVEGGQALRFCPRFPGVYPQFTNNRDYLVHSQKDFYALDMSHCLTPHDAAQSLNLIKDSVLTAEQDGNLWFTGSTYDPDNDKVYDGVSRDGIHLVTFAPILKNHVFPLADIVTLILDMGSQAMACAVEIEFAANLSNRPEQVQEFAFLQIRPAITGLERDDVSLDGLKTEDIICTSNMSLGNGRITHIRDIVYVKPETFDRAKTEQIARELGALNARLRTSQSPYVLIGFCRWGTSDPWLGIPVRWSQISHAGLIIECGLSDFYVEPSQGTHFFQNLVSHKIGYLTINPGKDGDVDWQWLASIPAECETDYIRHISLPQPLDIRINGHTRQCVILKPGAQENSGAV